MGNNLKILGSIDPGPKYDIAEQFVQAFTTKYPDVVGELYLGYPIYIDEIANRRICVDIA